MLMGLLHAVFREERFDGRRCLEMRAKVSQDKCIGCGLCAATVAEVFEMNADGKAEALGMVTVENKDSVQEAIDSCPVDAIAWEE